jgi:hypothetical protein
MQCPKCDYQAVNLNSLRVHAAKSHEVSSEELYLSIVSDGVKGTCDCGCGENTAFISLQKGYNKFMKGHAARIKNNWGHNPITREKSLKKRRDEGLWSKNPWNKGKRKDDDPEFASMCERAYNSPKEKARKSALMKELWANNSIVPLTGSNHPNWKGGTSLLSWMCHADTRLYQQWKLPKIKECNYKCIKCNYDQNLHVHHTETTMSQIIGMYRNQIENEELSYEEKQWVVDRVFEHHINENVKGIALCESCHEKEHKNLNFNNSY